jgi:arsenical pump membrane protein
MDEALAYSTLAMTVALAVSRPRVGKKQLRVTVGMAALLGVAVLLLGGLLRLDDLWTSARLQWRPLLTLTCVMVMTGVVKEVGAFERLALRIEALARETSTARAFDAIFLVSLVTPSLLNNDAAILLLTPVVVALARRLYPDSPRVLEAFAFAVFLAPGVAPLVISNPMNMIVAEYAGIGFNEYAAVMAPIAAVGAALTYAILRWHYREVLATPAATRAAPLLPAAHPAERPALAFLLCVFAAYPIMAWVGAPIWSVALAGALGSLAIAQRHRLAPARRLAGHVSIDILAFLWGVFLVVAALRNVGVVERLAAFYDAHDGHVGVVGAVAALGSAIVDNHPMSILNMLALDDQATKRPLFAALVGGDIGPRLLPIGSLAGLLWMDLLRRRGVDIGIGKFVRIGTLVLVPTLASSLLMLWALF